MSSYCRNVYISIIGQIDRKLLMFTYNSTLNSQRCYGRDQEIQWSHPRLSRHESFSVLRQRPRQSLRPHYQGGTRLWILCSQSWRAEFFTCVIMAMPLSELLLSEWLLCTTLYDNILWCHVFLFTIYSSVLIYHYIYVVFRMIWFEYDYISRKYYGLLLPTTNVQLQGRSM